MDRRSLTKQYASSANLAARIALHERCSTNAYGLQRWIFDQLQLTAGQRLLEAGCGTGSLWAENRDRIPHGLSIVLTDSSCAMVETTRRSTSLARLAACSLPELPFARGAFDVVVANHVLYHVDDRERAFTEIRRVLDRDGFLFAATNGAGHLREIKELMRAFGIESGDVSAGFSLENGEAQLRRVFGDVRRSEYPDSLRIDDPALLLAYIESTSERAREIVLAQGRAMREAIEDRIARDGAFYVSKSTGAFAA